MSWFSALLPGPGAASPSGPSVPSARLQLGFVPASVLAIWLACLADCFITPGPVNAAFVVFIACLGLGVGVLQGLGWELLSAAVSRFPRALRPLIWLGLSLAGAFWVAESLGAMVRLGSRYHRLALGVLAACAAGAVGVALPAIGLQPTDRSAYGPLRKLPRAARLPISAAFIGVAGALTFIDRRYYPGEYLPAHLALRVGAIWFAMFSALLAAGERDLVRFNRRRLAAVLGCFLIPVLFLRERDIDTLYAIGLRPFPSLALSLSRRLFDVDLDGYASVLGDGDCAPFNPAIHPGAREIPGNGVDDNCLAGDRVARPPATAAGEAPAPKQPSPLNAVLITIDAVRPDHMGLYNPAAYGPRGRATTPNLDRWSRDAVVFNRAYTAGGWTGISVASFLRGLYPRRLHWTTYFEVNRAPLRLLRYPFERQLRRGEAIAKAFLFASTDRHPPLSSWLKRRGMWTAAVLDDSYTEALSPYVGTALGFDTFREVDSLPAAKRDDAGTAELAIRTLNTMRPGQPFFLWAHFFGPHWPNEEHRGTRKYGNTVVDGYDHEIRYMDENVGRLLEAIDARPDRAMTAVFIASDHGEIFFSTVRTHGIDLTEGDIRVALMAKAPGWKPCRWNEPVSLIDLTPTILALTKTPAPPNLDGIDLGPRVCRSKESGNRVLIADTWQLERDGSIVLDMAGAFDGSHKLVFNRLQGAMYLYDQQAGPELRRPVYVQSRDRLTRTLLEYIEQTGGPPTVDK